MSKKLEHLFTWSISTARAFESCKRRRWLLSYGAWGGWHHDADPASVVAYRLKLLKSRAAHVGTLVHEIIREEILRVMRGGCEAADAEQLATIFLVRLRAAFKESRLAVTQGKSPPANKRMTVFEEHHFGLGGPEEDAKWLEAAVLGVDCIKTWRRVFWPMVRGDVAGEATAQRKASMVDEMATMFLPEALLPDDLKWCANVPFYVAPDLIASDPDGRNIVAWDWKTGKPSEDDKEQALAYVLFVEPDHYDTECRLAYLRDGGKEVVVGAPTTDEVCSFVLKHANLMREAAQMLVDEDVTKNVAEARTWREVAPPPGSMKDEYPCAYCSFRGLCFGPTP